MPIPWLLAAGAVGTGGHMKAKENNEARRICWVGRRGFMYTKIPIGNMGREEGPGLRRTGIGGSDAGAICGLNPYSSPMKIYQDKTCGISEEQDSEAVRQGQDLGGYVAWSFMEATGLKVRRSNYMYRSTEHPFMIANVDRLVIGEDAGLECKIHRIAERQNRSVEGTEKPMLEYFTPHQIRHTYTTLAYEAGADVKAVSMRLGHASEQVTRETYTHLRGKQKEEQDIIINKVRIG